MDNDHLDLYKLGQRLANRDGQPRRRSELKETREEIAARNRAEAFRQVPRSSGPSAKRYPR